MTNFLKRFWRWITFGILGISVVLAAGQFSTVEIASHLQLKTTENKILEYTSKTINRPDPDFDPEAIIAEDITLEAKLVKLNENKQISEDIVSYSYRTDIEIPYEKDEIEEKRTITTKFFDKGNGVTQAQMGSSARQTKVGDKWYGVNYATTTQEAWNEQVSEEKQVSEIMGASPLTEFSDSGGDGATQYLQYDYSVLSWFGLHCSAASAVYNGIDTMAIGSEWSYPHFGSLYLVNVRRGFIPFDTSGLPTDITISAATIRIYITSNNSASDLGLVQTTQDDPESLVTGDHQRCGTCPNTPTEGAPRMINPAVGNRTFTLNAAGRGWIVHDETNFSLFGLREAHDMDDTSGGTFHYEFLSVNTAEHTTDARKPLLTVTYTEIPPRRIIIIN